jgi:orotate phosphoribosyltransferase
MEKYKEEFIEFMVRSEVLTFGDFVTKSGRKTPFFINTGNYKTGEQIKKLGEFYAQAIRSLFGSDFDVLFGPAYKGIPLVITTSIALTNLYNINTSFCFDRKERKDHGEGGTIIGHKLIDNDRVVIVEDVTTAGTSIRETVPLLKKAADISLVGLIVSVDRMERGKTDQGALRELKGEFSMITGAIVTLDDIVGYLYNKDINGTVVLDDSMKERIDDYRVQYGVK